MSSDKPKKPDDKKPKEPLLMYIGDDVGFWKSFVKDIEKMYKAFKFRSEYKFGKDTTELQSLIKYLAEAQPRVIFFDISKYPEDILHLIRIMVRMNNLVKPMMFGLVDITTDQKHLRGALMAGLQIIHVKTSETEAIVHGMVCKAFPEKLEDHGFAMAKISDEVGAFFPAKIGYVNNKGLGVESNFPVAKGQQYLLHNWLTQKDIIASPLVKAESSTQMDLYYNFENAQYLTFEFAPQVKKTPDMNHGVFEQKKAEAARMVEKSKRGIATWIEANIGRSFPKDLKVLLIDKTFAMYEDQPKADNYDFVMRCQPYLKYPKKEILRTLPHLIVFQMEDISEEEAEAAASDDIAYSLNDTKTLQYLITTISSIKNYTPYIIVFNSMGDDTASLQRTFKYNQMVAYRENISPDLLIKMVELLKNKLGAKLNKVKEDTMVLNKAMSETYAEYEFQIKIMAITEMDLYFTSDLELIEGDVFRISAPAPMFVTVATRPKNAKVTTGYYGLIHGIGEDKRMQLRKFINSVFFRSLEEQKKAEREEVEKIKQQFMDTKKQAEEEAATARRQALEAERLAKMAAMEASQDDQTTDPDEEDDQE